MPGGLRKRPTARRHRSGDAAPRDADPVRVRREQGDPPWRHSKAGIVTTDLVPLAGSQRALIGQLDRERSASLMGALDACNARWGWGAVVPARAGLERQRRGWATKFAMRTPRYTTRVEELPVARA